jgi:hypothetical protein
MIRILGYVSIGLLMLFTVGCESFSGGGFIFSKIGPSAKANFGFAVTCIDDGMGGSTVNGTVEYQDKGFLVTGADGKTGPLRLHGTMNEIQVPLITCEEADALEQFFLHEQNVYVGGYVTQPTTVGSGGLFSFQPQDNGKPPNNADVFSIEIFTGAYAGYSNTGTLQGGNITLQ